MSACATIVGSNSEQAEPDWLDYSADLFEMPDAEQRAVRASAFREHEWEQSSDSAIRLAVVTVSLAQSTDELFEALALTEFAATRGAESHDLSFVSLLRLLIQKLLDREGALEQVRQEKLALQEQLDALRRLEQELNVQ